MSVIAGVLRNRAAILVQLGLVLILPWAWAAYVLPLWAIAVCGGLTVFAFLLGFRFFVTPTLTRQRAGDRAELTPEQIVAMRAPNLGKIHVEVQALQGELGALHGKLGRWQDTSKDSSGKTADAKEGMGEVISQTEQAVLTLTMSFRGITTKTRQQMETAMSLLQRNVDQASVSPGGWLSLPDYIRAYETQLTEVIDSMVKFSSASDEMLKHQEKVREQSVLIDEMLDELRSMAIRIGRLALDSSLAAGESGKNRDMLVKLTDSIREISDQTHGMTRTVRKGLESIRDELVVTYKVINRAAATAKESAERAKADVSQLNVTMFEKSKEIEDSLSKINSLGQQIQQDVNNAIVAMQFQDITQQKLEHMRGSVLAEVMKNLDVLSDETQEMMKKDIFTALKAEASRQNIPLSDAVKAAAEKAQSTGSDSKQTSSGTDASQNAPIKKVELF